MKTDARVRYTKYIIRTVFLDLLKEKSIETITVKEICDRVEINRSTFYKHYRDIYDLMEELEDEAINDFENLLTSTDTADSLTILKSILNTLAGNREIFKTSLSSEARNHFIEKLSVKCMKYVMPRLSHDPDLPAQYNSFALLYIAGGVTYIIQEWLKNGMKESPDEVSAFIEMLNSNVLSAGIKKTV